MLGYIVQHIFFSILLYGDYFEMLGLLSSLVLSSLWWTTLISTRYYIGGQVPESENQIPFPAVTAISKVTTGW